MDIRVMVASEVRLYRDALQSVLRGIPGIALAGVASSAEELITQACLLAPSVAVVDMAIMESVSIPTPVARAPQLGGVVVLNIPEVPAEVIGCLPSGILGFVSRDGTVAVLLDAIRAAGRTSASSKTSRAGMDDLTAREMEILLLMQEGVSNKTVSRQLGIELSTVKNHVHSILAKLGVHRRGEAVSLLYAHEKATRVCAALPVTGPTDADSQDVDGGLSAEAAVA